MDTAVKPEGRLDHVPASQNFFKETLHQEKLRSRPHVWQQACQIEEMPLLGDCVTRNINNESNTFWRKSEGQIHAFHHVGSHCCRRITNSWGASAETVSPSSRASATQAPAISSFHQITPEILFNEKPVSVPHHV